MRKQCDHHGGVYVHHRSVPRFVTHLIDDRRSHRHQLAGALIFSRKHCAVPACLPNAQRAVCGESCVDGVARMQIELACHVCGNSQGEAVTPLGDLQAY